MVPEKIGRYEVQKQLGRGGMATVFLAHDPLIGREVAIKVLPAQFSHDPSFRGRFEREARTVAMLEHPAILPIYDFGEQDGGPYLVMRYMKGGTLSERLATGPLPMLEISRIMERIASALDRAHAAGVIHRDLKPANILFDEYNQAYLADFGIVKVAESKTNLTGTGIIGTPAYMSPEQIRGEKSLDSRSDIYSLGIILFEMLTGKVPFKADTPAKLMIAHLTEPIPQPTRVNMALPAGCDHVIHKAMAKDKNERFASAGDMVQTLKLVATPGRTPAPHPANDLKTVIEPVPGPSVPAKPSPPPSVIRPDRPASPPVFNPLSAPVSPPTATNRYLLPAVGTFVGLVVCCLLLVAAYPLVRGQLNLPGRDTPAPTTQTNQTPTPPPPANNEGTTIAQTRSAANEAATATRSIVQTATAEALQIAITTRTWESTATAQARIEAQATIAARATATVLAATAEMQSELDFVLASLDAAQATAPLFGPQSGSLEHTDDGFINALSTDLDISNFVIEATFFNPYATSEGIWDIGFMFRDGGGNNQYRLVITSDSDWALDLWEETNIGLQNEGTATNLDTGLNGQNRITLYVNGSVGYFWLNGLFISKLDLSYRPDSGNIFIGSGFYIGNEIPGRDTPYQGFAVWAVR